MEPLKIGNIILPHRAVFGPMAGFADAPCRRLMAQHGAGFTVSEMVSSRALVYGDHKTVSLLKAEPNGAPYGVQIFGEVPEIMGEATAAIEQYEFDSVIHFAASKAAGASWSRLWQIQNGLSQ